MFFSIHNTSIRRATFRVMKVSCYVIVDDSGNYVVFRELDVHMKIKKIITPCSESLRACVSVQ